MRFDTGDRAVSPVIASVLLVAIVAILAGFVLVFGFGFTEKLGGPQPTDATVTLESTSTGLVASVDRVSEPVEVQVNGETLYTVNQSDVGSQLYLPTSPGDRVTVVSADEDNSLILSKEVDENEAGDFILSYNFDSQSGTTIDDASGHGNDGVIGEYTGSDGGVDTGVEPNGPAWETDSEGTHLEYDGTPDAGRAADLTIDGPDEVEEFTVATRVRVDSDTGDIQQFVEYRNPSRNFEWLLETQGFSGGKYRVDFHPFFPDSATSMTTGYEFETGETYVFVAKYNGTHSAMYVYDSDGNLVSVKSKELPSSYQNRPMEMGRLWIGNDLDAAKPSQPLDGGIYDLRLYYVAFDRNEAGVLADSMT